jgi:GT2 family glycosyltransferase
VCVVLLTWNGKGDTLECLESLTRQTYPRLRLLVVDNGSSDGTAEAVRSRYPQVDVLVLPENVGATGGDNAGMVRAFRDGADYALLLNNDTTVDPRAIEELVAAARAYPRPASRLEAAPPTPPRPASRLEAAPPTPPRPALFSPVILYYDQPDTVWYAGGQVDLATGHTRHEYAETTDYPQQPYPTQWANLCACLLPREVFTRVGLSDNAYFIFHDDVDLSLRAARAGYESVVVPAAKVWHKVSATGRGRGHYYYYSTRNRLYFVRKFSGLARAALWAGRMAGGAAVYGGAALLRRQKAEAKTYLFMLCGVLAYVLGDRGRAPQWVYRWGKI